MKLRKFAIRGLVGVAICVALCMFFSGTIESITTPKVKLVKASRGKLVQNVELDAVVVYPETKAVRMELPAGQTLTISRVNVRAGYQVKAGDVIVEAAVTGYDAAMEQAQAAYDAALDELMSIKRKYGSITLRRSEQSYADAYAALREEIRNVNRAETEMNLILRASGLDYVQEGYPADAGEDVRHAMDAYRSTQEKMDAAQRTFDEVSRRGIDENIWNYISESQAVQEKLDGCAGIIVELEERNRAASAICAEHDGYIASVTAQAGMLYDGSTELFSITLPESAPVLRADLSGVEQSVKEGMKVEFPSSRRGDLKTKVFAIGYTETGAKYADVAITEDMISASGSLYSMTQGSQRLNLEFKAGESTCLLPASAVRGSGEDRYVYTVTESSSGFGKLKKTVSKTDVTVIAEADGTASIEEDVSWYSIAYMEDRPLSEGSAVMEYAS